MLDRFTGWIEGFPTWTEKAEEVVRKLLHEIILRFGLPKSLQSGNGTSFTSKVSQEVSEALGITYYLHCAWRPQSSGKVERANQFFKSVMKMITQETSMGWKEALPIALLRTILPLRNRLVLVLQFSSVAQSCPPFCNPMNRSKPGLPNHHQLPEFTQTHVRPSSQ